MIVEEVSAKEEGFNHNSLTVNNIEAPLCPIVIPVGPVVFIVPALCAAKCLVVNLKQLGSARASGSILSSRWRCWERGCAICWQVRFQ